MFHYLRTKDGYSIVDVEPYIRDGKFQFTGGVCNLAHFLNFYDTIPVDKQIEFKTDFADIDEMRGWFYEKFLPLDLNYEVNDKNLSKAHTAIKNWLAMIAEKYDLVYGSD